MFCLLPNVYLVYCLQTNHRYCWSLWLTFFISVTLVCWRANMNQQHTITSRILQFGSYHWRKSKTIDNVKLSLAEHYIQYLWIWKPDLQLLQQSDALLNRIHTNWWCSLKSLLEEVYQLEFCGFLYQMLLAGQSESCQHAFRCQNFSKFCH